MKLPSRFHKLWIFICISNLLSNQMVGAQRLRYSINDEWRFMKMDVKGFELPDFDDQYWQGVHLPHTWNVQDAFDEERGYYQGIGCYRKQFFVPANWGTKQIYVYFEGANHTAEVFINGSQVGKHQGGYTAFSFNITPYVKANQFNTLAVKVSNAPTDELAPISGDFTFYGGIYRDVYLIATSQNHFSFGKHAGPGVYFYTPNVSQKSAKPKIDVHLEIGNQQTTPTLLIELIDKQNKVVATAKKSLKITKKGYQTLTIDLPEVKNPILWQPSNPYLYQLKASLIERDEVVDEVWQRCGIRWFRFDADKGFFINGQPLKLMGANRHQDFEGIGNALSDHQHRNDVALLKELGANFIRIAHYPQDPALLQACDELGIMAWEEIPIVNEIGINHAFVQSSIFQLSDMILQHFNHPSVITWGYMNEVLLRFPRNVADSLQRKREQATLRLAQILDSTAKKLDPYRPTAMAMHGSQHYNETGVGNVTDLKGWNLYHGWYNTRFEDFKNFLDEDHKKYPSKPIIVSEYGAGSDLRLHSLEPEMYDFTCEYMQQYHESYLPQIMERPYISGALVWNLVDFGSESRKESMEQVNNKGLVTFNRTKKDIFYYYKAALSREPMVHIASRDWPVRVRTASQPDVETTTWPIKIYTNRPFVELRVNGLSYGKQVPKNFHCTWNVSLTHGTHIIEARADSAIDVFVLKNRIRPHVKSNNFTEIAVNVGSKAFFEDSKTHLVWEPDQAYSSTSGWGHIGGRPYRYSATRIGTQDNIFHTLNDPLYQTMQDSIAAYRFDVAAGIYEVELHIAEANAKIKTGSIYMDFGNTTVSEVANQRLFEIWVNGKPTIPKLEPISKNGQQIARCIKFEAKVEAAPHTKLEIQIKPLVGKPCLSGIFVKKLY